MIVYNLNIYCVQINVLFYRKSCSSLTLNLKRKTKICVQVYYVIEAICINTYVCTKKATTQQNQIMSP